MIQATELLSPRQRILEKAEELFYAQGYQATGINQIIDESGVAKATFYTHFPSKEDLCVAYLERVQDKEFELIMSTMAKRKSAIARYQTAIEVLEPWLIGTNFRGCPFLNIASEISDERHPIRQVGIRFYRKVQALVAQTVRELKDSDKKKYAHIDPEAIAERYMTILIGAIGLCEVYHSVEPIRNGIRMTKQLLE